MRPRIPTLLLCAGILCLPACESGLWADGDEAWSAQARTAAEVLPADARFVGHLDIRALRQNDLFEQHPFATMAPAELRGEAEARLRDFLETTGFDLEEDIQEIYFAAGPNDGRIEPSFVLYADYDPRRLGQYLEAHLGDALVREIRHGASVYRGHDEGAFALIGGDLIVVAASVQRLDGMLARLDGEGAALATDPRMRTLLDQTNHADAWLIARDLDLGETGSGAADLRRMGSAVRDMAFTVSFSDRAIEGEVLMVPREGVQPEDLADLAQGMIALARTNVDRSEHRDALDDVRVRTRGQVVRLRFTVDNDLIAGLR